MSILYFAFWGEGRNEYDFLSPLIERVLTDLIPHVDVQAIAIDDVPNTVAGDRDRLLWIAQQYDGFPVAIYHMDADTRTTESTLANRFQPAHDALQRTDDDVGIAIVPVIPVHNTNAWMLVDFDAFRQAVGTHKTAAELGFPDSPHQVEALPDARPIFRQAVQQARGGRKRKVSFQGLYKRLANAIDLQRLRQVPAYQEFEGRLRETLITLHYLEQ